MALRKSVGLAVVVLAAVVTGVLVVGFGEHTGGAPAPATAHHPAADHAGHGSAWSCVGAAEAVADCLELHYTELTRRSGPQVALAALAGESQVLRTSCHQLTHAIGRAAAERYQRIPEAFDQGRQLCGMGYYHGVMQTTVERMGREAALASVNTMCADLGQSGRGSAYHLGCAHGLGHGLMAVLDDQLFDALDGCDRLSDPWERGHCENGVFMENLHTAHHSDGTAAFLRPAEPLYPCTAVADRHKDQCFEKQTSYAVVVAGGDFARVFELCRGVGQPFQVSCYRGLGRNAFEAATGAGSGEAQQVAVVRQRCDLGPDETARSTCLAWAARYFVIFNGNATRAGVLCTGVPPADRPSCARSAADAEGLFRE